MVNPSVKVQSRGRVTLPAQMRLDLGLEPGDEVDFVETAPGRYEVQPKSTRAALLRSDAPRTHLSVKVRERDERQKELPL